MEQKNNTIKVDVAVQEGKHLGFEINSELVIANVQQGSPVDGKLQIGDVIMAINGTKVEKMEEVAVLVKKEKMARFEVSRFNDGWEDLPAELKPKTHRRDGYSYFVCELRLQKGRKLGLGVKDYQNRVMVARVEDGSISADYLTAGDHIILIDGNPISSKEVAREMMVKGIRAKQYLMMVIERAESDEAKEWTAEALESHGVEGKVVLGDDVKEILGRMKTLFSSNPPKSKKSCLAKAGESKKGNVKISEEIKSHLIGSDNEGRELRPVASLSQDNVAIPNANSPKKE